MSTVTAGVALSVAHGSRVTFNTASPETHTTVSAFGRSPDVSAFDRPALVPAQPTSLWARTRKKMPPQQDTPAEVSQNAVPLAHFGTIRAPRAGLRPRARYDAPQIVVHASAPRSVQSPVLSPAAAPAQVEQLQTYMAPLPLPMRDAPSPAQSSLTQKLPPEYLIGVYR
ncbi:hypothetical protein [Sulfitobacter noctilucae]|uniref:hypothetical protein n=1 Tax=Sulfitobacter noctilucae TaxID=1342302 RepID=UPI0012688B50|nr:hypothetical protein [Sulfitobacter noctilucae]